MDRTMDRTMDRIMEQDDVTLPAGKSSGRAPGVYTPPAPRPPYPVSAPALAAPPELRDRRL